MAVRELLTIPDPRLRRLSAPVERFDDPELAALLEDLRDTMAANDGVGLAAPQIGVPLRVVIFGITCNPRYPEAPSIPETVLINPVLMPLGDDLDDAAWEGCLSVPGWRAQVPRWRRLHYRACDVQGQTFEREVEGFHARVVQHECDHLDGVLFPDRMAVTQASHPFQNNDRTTKLTSPHDRVAAERHQPGHPQQTQLHP
jgi:peptide deformylase